MVEFIRAETKDDFLEIEKIAREIMLEHFVPLVGVEKMNYMISKFLSPDSIRGQIGKGFQFSIVKDLETSLGFISVCPEEYRLYLSKFYLYQDARGKGTASIMMKHVAESAKSFGCKSISLTVNKDNIDVINIYKHYGFQISGEVFNDIGNGYHMNGYDMTVKTDQLIL